MLSLNGCILHQSEDPVKITKTSASYVSHRISCGWDKIITTTMSVVFFKFLVFRCLMIIMEWWTVKFFIVYGILVVHSVKYPSSLSSITMKEYFQFPLYMGLVLGTTYFYNVIILSNFTSFLPILLPLSVCALVHHILLVRAHQFSWI